GEQARILRPITPPIDQPGEMRYEIFHDVLAPAILNWRVKYVEKQKRIETERQLEIEAQERAKAEEQLAREQRLVLRQRGLLALMALLLMAMAGVTAYAFSQRSKAQLAEKQAVAAAQSTVEALERESAERSKAEEQRIVAFKAKADADTQRDAAEKASAE